MVKATCMAAGKILNAKLNIDICNELKALVIDPTYWKGVAAMETLFMMISSHLTYLEGDETTFSAVYACFVAIKYHIKTFNRAVMDAFNLGDDDIERMMTLLHHHFLTIYSEAHGLTFVTNPMFTDMRSKIAAKFNKDFLQVQERFDQPARKGRTRPSFKWQRIPPTIIFQVRYQHCTRTWLGQEGASLITRRANAFTVAHALGWAKPRSRRDRHLVQHEAAQLPQHGIRSSASGCSNSVLTAEMMLKRSP
ncbi:unnamed protein product [Sphagnum troendelagicum]|uniref:Uncharacterized protein n=1 Tax=Sphagnum troendelagicum TaxID=128251 RepID=A0ABP0UG92_9BRYO